MKRLLSISVLCVAAVTAIAGWRGFPVAQAATNVMSWHQLMTNDYAGQLVAAVNERRRLCAYGASRRDPTNWIPLQIVETWPVDVGFTTCVEVVGGHTYTSRYVRREWSTVTNQTTAYAYGSNTVVPHLTRYFAAALQEAVAETFDGGRDPDNNGTWWASTNALVDGNLDAWWRITSTNGERNSRVPQETLPGFMARSGVGHVYRPDYDGVVTQWVIDADASLWTWQPQHRGVLPLADAGFDGTNWIVRDGDSIQHSLYNTYWAPSADGDRPVLVWDSITSAVAGDRRVALGGWAKQRDAGDGYLHDVETSAVVTVSGPVTLLSAPWSDVTTCTPTGAAWQAGDSLAIVWTSRWVSYGPAPVALNAAFWDELWTALQSMRWLALWTHIDIVATNSAGDSWILSGGTETTAAAAKASLDAKLADGQYATAQGLDDETLFVAESPGAVIFPAFFNGPNWGDGLYQWNMSDVSYAGAWRRAWVNPPVTWSNIADTVGMTAQTYMLRETNSAAAFSPTYSALSNRFTQVFQGYAEIVSNRVLCTTQFGDDFVTPASTNWYDEQYEVYLHHWMYVDLTAALEYP